ncbi:hypothetical protein ALC62_01358 [Cyphomyrmex costatus]|uniref:Uncharacterized protein n=1 Tax=Cyphomyrmex costatus TaxID=456900 RepID=A0A151IPB0_9HYME|nr:hypothetical protein ALC62_01358 [Cyphomyrmex costatus]
MTILSACGPVMGQCISLPSHESERRCTGVRLLEGNVYAGKKEQEVRCKELDFIPKSVKKLELDRVNKNMIADRGLSSREKLLLYRKEENSCGKRKKSGVGLLALPSGLPSYATTRTNPGPHDMSIPTDEITLLDDGCDGAGPLAAEVKVRRCTVENPLNESGPFAVLWIATPTPAPLLWRPSSRRSYWLRSSDNDEDVAHVGLFDESEPHEFQVKTMMMGAIQGRGIDRGKNRSA